MPSTASGSSSRVATAVALAHIMRRTRRPTIPALGEHHVHHWAAHSICQQHPRHHDAGQQHLAPVWRLWYAEKTHIRHVSSIGLDASTTGYLSDLFTYNISAKA